MKALLKFELWNYFRSKGFYVLLILVILFGVFTGANFSLSIGPEIFKNGSYTVSFMTGFLSLFCIFFSTLLATQILFREKDNNFDVILYATPLLKKNYLISRLLTVVSISLLCFILLISGFAIGQQIASDKSLYTHFNSAFYLLPLCIFGIVNTIFCSAILCTVAWLTKNKVLVYVSGLFIYIIYMVMLIFSGSPLMARGMPQSPEMVQLSASLDPFGLSGFFLQTSSWSIIQRNTELIFPSGIFLLNRIGVLLLSCFLIVIAFKTFSFFPKNKRRSKTSQRPEKEKTSYTTPFQIIKPVFDWKHRCTSLLSFTKIDLKYITKGVPFILTCIGLLFASFMEMYGAIEKGIRIPEKYASSGLMAQTIIDSIHALCLIVILYYANEILWRSRNNRFHLIENSTPVTNSSLFFSKWLTLTIIILFFTTLMILLGIIIQFFYHYPTINWYAYAGVYLFTSLPLMISAGIILIIQHLIKHKYAGIIVSSAIVLLTATSIGKQFLKNPLLRFQIPYNGLYSDMNGYGSYAAAYAWRICFGACITLFLCLLVTQINRYRLKPLSLIVLLILSGLSFIARQQVIADYLPKDGNITLLLQADYEKKYRRFQNIAQPAVTAIVTNIDLFPEQNAYEVSATYILKNKTPEAIDSILINFADNIDIKAAVLRAGNETIATANQYSVISLKKALQPGDSATFIFKFSYHWAAVNGHEPFNAILDNGSFLRISRYYPTIGYSSDREIESERDRKKYDLGQATKLVLLEAPKIFEDDFINLEMTISTSNDQSAIGVGELVKKWKLGNRNFFSYKTLSPIPFRFAVSSARYAIATSAYRGKMIEVYYHPRHYENVEHLIKNIQLTLDYCETNFGPYPFNSIRFAEVSAFTRGFAATAYPNSIFMTENMVFNANIKSDKNQDVINELAGHELSHLWWGNSQIAPDEREGAGMLTETLAMYSELMLVKKMHGKSRVLENIKMHQGIYLDERGFTDEQPLYKVKPGNVHLMYSKGVVAMYELSELIGEAKLNRALQHFLQQYAYPKSKAISTDFLAALYAVSDSSMHPKIDDLFKKITLFDFKIKNTSLKKTGSLYELSLNATATKFYEDGKGQKINVLFSDSVDLAIHFKNGKEKISTLPVINNKISYKILLTEKPVSVEIDPDMKFLKIESGWKDVE